MRQDLLDFLTLLDGDLAVDDELGGTNVDVVAAAALPVLEDEAGVEGAVVELEADALEALEKVAVQAVDAFCGVDVEAFEDGGGGAVHIQVTVFDGWLSFELIRLCLVRTGEKGTYTIVMEVWLYQLVHAVLAGEHTCRASLDHSNLRTLLIPILRNIVSAVAAPYYHRLLPRRRLRGSGELRAVADAVALE